MEDHTGTDLPLQLMQEPTNEHPFIEAAAHSEPTWEQGPGRRCDHIREDLIHVFWWVLCPVEDSHWSMYLACEDIYLVESYAGAVCAELQPVGQT